jgi:hypothetical protein
LLQQNNPTCNSKQYVGGLSCCHHMRVMLDEDQSPGTGPLLQYHMKWRFWFQEYKPKTPTTPPSHYDLPRIYYQTEVRCSSLPSSPPVSPPSNQTEVRAQKRGGGGIPRLLLSWWESLSLTVATVHPISTLKANAGEYDIPPAFSLPGNPVAGYGNWPLNKTTPGTTCTGTCPDGPDCDCVHTIVARWTMSNTRLVYAGGHCHARCAFFDRDLHSRMPFECHAFASLEALPCVCPMAFLSGVHYLLLLPP